MKYIAILDTETTGLDYKNGEVLEVAVILYDIQSRSIISQASTLLYAESNPAFEINRIDVSSLKKVPPSVQKTAMEMIANMMLEADALVAHNATFDKNWIETVIPFQQISKNKKWICTRNDVVWPVRKGCPLNLIHICADLGVPIINAHRALSDCHLLLDAIECLPDIDSFIDKSGKGRITYHAQINYDERQIVKDAGFMWDNLKKVWHAKITPEQAAELPFTVYPGEITCINP